MKGSGRGRVRSAGLLLAVAVAGVSLLWLRFNVPPGRVGRPFPHDLVYYFLPQLDAVGARLAAGELPLWNPDPCTGLPLLASMQVAVFYPTTWLAAVIPAAQALGWIVLLHWLLGGVACAALFRVWGLAPVLAGAFGVVFVFACMVGQSFWPPMVVTLSWLPVLLLCTERVMAGERADVWWLALAFCFGLQLLAGFPQLTAYGLQLVVPFALLRGWQRARAGSRGPAAVAGLRFVAALLLGAGIGAVQLGPSFQVLWASERTRPFSEAEAHYLQSRPRLEQIVANAVDPAPRLTSYELGHGAGYLGVGVLVLAGVALVARRRDPLTWGLAGSGLLWLVLSDGYLGVGSELYRLYALLPGVGLFRAPERLLAPAFLCFVALAARGAEATDRAHATAPRERGWIVATAAFLAAGIAVVGAPGAAWRAAIAFAWVALGAGWQPWRRRADDTGASEAEAGPRPGGARRLGLRAAWRAAGAVLLVADVAAATGSFGSLRDVPERFARRMRAGTHVLLSDPELARLRKDAGPMRIEFVAPGMQVRPLMGIGAAGGIRRLACYETLLPGQWTALSRLAHGPDYRSAVMSNIDPERLPAVYDAASVATWVRADRRNGKPPLVSIVENHDALPRAYLVDRFEVVPVEKALERLVRGDVDVHRQVLLDADPGLAGPGSLENAIPATLAVLEPERVVVVARSPGDAILVLTDTDAPGWTAQVDGAPTPILRANGLFRAVRVPGGEHRVVFRYAPAGLRWGAAISLASAAFAIAWFAWGRPRGRGRGRR